VLGTALLVFKFCRRNPKIIMRWPCHRFIDHKAMTNGKIRPSGGSSEYRAWHQERFVAGTAWLCIWVVPRCRVIWPDCPAGLRPEDREERSFLEETHPAGLSTTGSAGSEVGNDP